MCSAGNDAERTVWVWRAKRGPGGAKESETNMAIMVRNRHRGGVADRTAVPLVLGAVRVPVAFSTRAPRKWGGTREHSPTICTVTTQALDLKPLHLHAKGILPLSRSPRTLGGVDVSVSGVPDRMSAQPLTLAAGAARVHRTRAAAEDTREEGPFRTVRRGHGRARGPGRLGRRRVHRRGVRHLCVRIRVTGAESEETASVSVHAISVTISTTEGMRWTAIGSGAPIAQHTVNPSPTLGDLGR